MIDRLKRWLWRRTLRLMGDAVYAMDSWVHEQERRLQAPAAPVRDLAVDPAESRARERAIVKTRRIKQPRLRYDHGVFVRTEAR